MKCIGQGLVLEKGTKSGAPIDVVTSVRLDHLINSVGKDRLKFLVEYRSNVPKENVVSFMNEIYKK